MKLQRRMRTESIFSLSMWPPVFAACILTVIFYGLLLNGFLEIAILKRYCLCHPVAYATVGFFFVALCAMAIKIHRVRQQRSTLDGSVQQLASLIQEAPAVSPSEAARWLDTLWKAQPTEICHSWFGQRITEVVQRQMARGSSQHLDEDMRELAERDADQLHDSYGLVRIVSWAMPMLGFLGTVIGISDTLGQMDIGLLSNGSSEALNGLTAGLYVAFDTTAIGLVLTIVSMFTQFLVMRVETTIIEHIDRSSSEYLVAWLGKNQEAVEAHSTSEVLKQLTTQLATVVESVVQKQSELWKQTIDEAHQRWQSITGTASDEIQQALGNAIASSLEKHAKYLEKVQSDGADQIDHRWHQWQTSLSEQARSMHDQRSELIRQSDLLSQLVTKLADIDQIDRNVEERLSRVTDVDRFHEAAVCLSEAVAMIGMHMERSGLLKRGGPRGSTVSQPSQDHDSKMRGKAA